MRTKKYLIVGGLIIIVFAVIFFFIQKDKTYLLENQIDSNAEENVLQSTSTDFARYTSESVVQISSKESIPTGKAKTQKAELIIGDKKIIFDFIEGQTVYDVMKTLQIEDKIFFTGKEYPMFGFFVTSIDSFVSGDGKNLFYYINDEEASVGISTYQIRNGDIIEWKLK